MAEFTDPCRPWSEATRALEETLIKRGNAVAARIPKITMTTTNSINVKPFCFFAESDLRIQYSIIKMTAPQLERNFTDHTTTITMKSPQLTQASSPHRSEKRGYRQTRPAACFVSLSQNRDALSCTRSICFPRCKSKHNSRSKNRQCTMCAGVQRACTRHSFPYGN